MIAGAEGSTTVGVITTPLMTGALSRRGALDILDRIRDAWGLGREPREDAVLQGLGSWLSRPVDPNERRAARFRRPPNPSTILKGARSLSVRDILRSPARLSRWAARQAESPAIYLHTSHAQLDRSDRFSWLARHRLRSAFFLHDAIPLDFPEYCSPGADARHLGRLRTVADLASLIVMNSEVSARALKRWLADHRLPTPAIEVAPLGVDDWFLSRAALAPPEPAAPYFLCVGTIEPRKNHLFLLAIWRRLIEKFGARAPRLILAGRRGWENENVIDVLERSRVHAPFVAEASDLTDSGLASLMAGAQAVVAPSLAEGFGLPVAEALAVGTPVLASDIPAHREVGGGFATYLDPIDGPGWVSTIQEFCEPASLMRRTAVAGLARYRPMRWSEHVRMTTNLLERAAAE